MSPERSSQCSIAWPSTWLPRLDIDRKSTRLNSSHVKISYAVFCLKKKKCHTSSLLAESRTTVSEPDSRPNARSSAKAARHNSSTPQSGLRLAMAVYFFFNDTATTEIYTLSLHDALPI